MEDPTTIAILLADAALEAWQDIAERADRHDEVAMGADGTPSTRGDLHVEKAMLAVASSLGLSVLSEEAGHVNHGSDYVAIIDPVDGTRNAGRGIPFFCTSVALMRNGVIEAGAVQNLVTADLYVATAGKGATFNGKPIRQPPYNADEIMVGIIADYGDQEITHAQTHAGHHLRDLGAAALELCLVGTGALDAFCVHQPWLRVVDVAAGTLFVREAGGIVLDPSTGTDLELPLDVTTRLGVLAARSQEAMEAVR